MREKYGWRLKDYKGCPHDAEDGEKLCIFHLPLKRKREDEGLADRFEIEFRKLYERGEWDFIGFVFPDGMDLSERNGLDFRREHEREGRELKEDEDDQPVRFLLSKFGNDLNCRATQFGTGTLFDGATFGDGATFEFSHFGDGARFDDAHFGDRALFWRAKFGHGASFFRSRFGNNMDFRGSEFGHYAGFESATIGQDADFSRATFEGLINFRGITGREFSTVDFGTVEIEAIGSEENRRISAAITKDLTGRMERTGPPEFVFERTTFKGPALFHYVDLSRSRFQQVDLSKVSFLHAKIAETRFISCKWGKGFEHPWLPSFLSWPWETRRFFKRRGLIFDECLWRARRYYQLLRAYNPETRLLDVVKNHDGAPYQLNKLQVPADIQPSDIEVLALQLKESLERTKDPITAGDFHFAAMEMKRYKAMDDGRKGRAAALWLYKMLSGYGERPLRALVWLLITIGIAAIIFGASGLDFGPALFEAIKCSLPFKFDTVTAGQTIDLGKLISYETPGSIFRHWLGLIETFVGTALFAFFLLALRRRFKR